MIELQKLQATVDEQKTQVCLPLYFLLTSCSSSSLQIQSLKEEISRKSKFLASLK
jgi:hypothetical protein